MAKFPTYGGDGGWRSFERKAEHVPVVGPWFGRLGKIKQIAAIPCTPTPEIWVQAAFQAIPMAIFSAFAPSTLDFLGQRTGRGGTIPAGGWSFSRGKAGGRPGGGPSCHVPKFKLDIWATETSPKITPRGQLSWFAMRGIQLFRRVGWYFTIIDATTSGTLYWVSLAYQWSGCDTPGGAWTQISTENAIIIFPNIWARSFVWTKVESTWQSPLAQNVVVQPDHDWAVSWSASTQELEIQGFKIHASAKWRLYNQTTDSVADEGSTVKTADGRTITSGFIHGGPTPGHQQYELQHYITGGIGCLLTYAHVTASMLNYQSGLLPGYPDPTRGPGIRNL